MGQYSFLVDSFTIGHFKCINSSYVWVVKISKAYIPLRRETIRVGSWRWHPQRHNIALGIPTCWYLKTRKHPTPNLKCALPPTPNLKCALPPSPNPDASQWNILRLLYSKNMQVITNRLNHAFCIRVPKSGMYSRSKKEMNQHMKDLKPFRDKS